MKLNKLLTVWILCLPMVFISAKSIAQQPSIDFFGEIRDEEHPPGYREFVEMGCWQCHGFQGSAGRTIINPLMPFEGFRNQVRRPYGVMPAYSPNVLSDEKIRQIYQYLENLPPSPDPESIPLLSVQ